MTKVRISQMTFGESEFVRGNKVWRAESLYLFAQAKGYEVRDLPLWAVDLTIRSLRITSRSSSSNVSGCRTAR